MITGIYKITSPSKKIYIGQSVDIKRRWRKYKDFKCEKQPKLYNSFKKYGIEKHIFEIVCQCTINELNEMERFYQDAFCVIDLKGLNCVLTTSSDRSGTFSIESKIKMSIAQKGKIISEETRAKMSASRIGRVHSIETRKKLSESGKNMSEEKRNRISSSIKNFSDEHRYKISKAAKNRSAETRKKISDNGKGKIKYSKKVLSLETGVFFDSAKEASICFRYNYFTFLKMINGKSKNKTNCIYI